VTDRTRTIPNPLECLYIACSTACNLRCRFCAYPLSTIRKANMQFSTFAVVVDQATAFGFETFNLTPLVGEALVDPGFLDKLNYLEQHAGVHDFYFCTNLTLAERGFFDSVSRFRKLRCFSVSIYGHDEDSFSRLTGADRAVYQRLLDNLRHLATDPQLAARSEFRIRSGRAFRLEHCQSELCTSLQELERLGSRIRIPQEYQNWGGLIEATRLEGLDLTLKDNAPRTEPCVFLYFKHTVLPDGMLNACSSGDGNASLTIGNLLEQTFEQIYSTSNTRYAKLLEAQRAGQFSPLCQVCTGYRSISASWYSYTFHRQPFMSEIEFERWLANPKNPPAQAKAKGD